MNAAVNLVAQGMAIRRPKAKVPCKKDKKWIQTVCLCFKSIHDFYSFFISSAIQETFESVIQAGLLSLFAFSCLT